MQESKKPSTYESPQDPDHNDTHQPNAHTFDNGFCDKTGDTAYNDLGYDLI